MIRGGMVTLGVKDVGASVRFYVETLGMKLVAEGQGGQGGDVIDAGEGFRIALVKGDAKASLTLFSKLPMAEAVQILENRGVVVTKTAEGAAFDDPDGHHFTLRQG